MSINQLEKKNNYSLNCENLYVDDDLTVNGNIIASNLQGGTYAPTFINASNMVSATAQYAAYTDVNNVVTVYLTISLTVTDQTQPTAFFVSIPPLPVPQPPLFPSVFSVSGSGTQVNNVGGTSSVYINADTGSLLAGINCPPAGGSLPSGITIYCYFSYIV